MSDSPKSFFSTLPGVLTGLASLIAAITGLYIATDGFKQVSEQSAQPTKKMLLDEEQHQQQVTVLQRQKELDDLRINQERQKILAEQELETLRQASRQRAKDMQQEAQQATQADPQPAAVNISGNWYLTNGFGTFTFVLGQSGTQITLQEFDAMGNVVGTGQGFIDARQVFLSWVEPYMFVASISIEAQLYLSPDATHLSGTMVAQGNQAAIVLYRN
ncbi:MAG: hypothetical protein ACI9C4_000063 [Paraglaciecola sp.]|jgi:hypothetical protein